MLDIENRSIYDWASSTPVGVSSLNSEAYQIDEPLFFENNGIC